MTATLLVVLAALLGAGVAVGLLAVTGSIGGGGTTETTVFETASTTEVSDDSGAGGGLDAEALYANTAAGVVEIASKHPGAGEGSPNPFGEPETSEATATGAGFVIDRKGRVVTAAHVVDEATSITVTLQDGTRRSAKLLGKDDATDVAVLELDPSGLTLLPLQLGGSASLQVGAEVAAIGSPFEYEGSISTGIVSGLDRTIEAPNGFTVAHAIQTDAAINPGNSGGPLLDSAGNVVGVIDQIATSGADQSSGVGFAVPSDLIASELAALTRGEEVRHAYLGVATTTSTGPQSGALVQEVVSGSPAAKAGLRSGDVVTAIGGTAIGGSDDLVAAIAEREPGDRVTLRVRRGSDSLSLDVTLSTQPAESSLGR